MDKLNKEFIIDLKGKSFVTYEGLLDLAHRKGLKSLEVDIIQVPNKANNMTAICQAMATTEKEIYMDIGDASPHSVTNNLIPHLIRMASTRAKARALRDLTNIGMTAIEELSVEDNNIAPDVDPPTERQLNTLQQLVEQLNYEVDFEKLTKKTAGTLIAELLEKAK